MPNVDIDTLSTPSPRRQSSRAQHSIVSILQTGLDFCAQEWTLVKLEYECKCQFVVMVVNSFIPYYGGCKQNIIY